MYVRYDGQRWAPLMFPSMTQPHSSESDILALQYAVWQEFIQQRCGLHFTPSRLRFLHQRLEERMRLRHMRSLQEYYHYVAFNPAGTAEWQELLDLLLNNETSFFRHSPSFATLTSHVLPALVQAKGTRPGQTLTMWSAGCSMGQEVYSLAMTCVDFLTPPAVRYTPETPDLASQWQIKILGSDISRRALAKARQGQYKAHELRSLPERYRSRYFTAVGSGHTLVYHVVPQIQALVDFSPINLQDPATYPLPYFEHTGGGMDIIFCQNVLIYFDTPHRLEIVQRLCQRLRPGGYLFLGPAEVVGLKLPGIEPVRFADALLYQRTV